jgi:hypothetical protein
VDTGNQSVRALAEQIIKQLAQHQMASQHTIH